MCVWVVVGEVVLRVFWAPEKNKEEKLGDIEEEEPEKSVQNKSILDRKKRNNNYVFTFEAIAIRPEDVCGPALDTVCA